MCKIEKQVGRGKQLRNNKLKVEICVKVTSQKILSTKQFLRATINFFPGE